MARTKLVFYGTDKSKTTDVELVCYMNDNNEIYIHITDPFNGDVGSYQFICLDKATAIKLHRELKKQISYIGEGVEGE